MRKFFFGILLSLIIVINPSITFTTPEAPKKEKLPFNPQTTLLTTLSPEVLDYTIKFSPDGRKVAYLEKRKNKYPLIVNGKKQKYLGKIAVNSINFSPDGKNVYYVSQKEDKDALVVDGKPGEKYDEVFIGDLMGPYFSPNGKRIAYKARQGDDFFYVINGRKEKKYEDVERLYFTPDSQNYYYLAEKGGKAFLVQNGQEGKHYDEVSDLKISPNGKKIAYMARQGGKQFVVINGQVKKYFNYDKVTIWKFSPDSQKIVYLAKLGTKKFLILNNQEFKKYDEIYSPKFSSDSQRFGFNALKDGKGILVIDGKEIKKYDEIRSFDFFGPDGLNAAYMAKKSNNQFAAIYEKESRRYNNVDLPVFSPDGLNMAYIATRDNKEFVVINGNERNEYDEIYKIGPYTPDYDTYRLHFSPDSQFLGYYARLGNKIWWVVEKKPFLDKRSENLRDRENAKLKNVLKSGFNELFQIKNIQQISIKDSWMGYSTIGQTAKFYQLKPADKKFIGKAIFTAGVGDKSRTLEESIEIPHGTIQKFLNILVDSILEKGPYEPKIETTDDYPSIDISIKLGNESLEIFSQSQGFYSIPWGLNWKSESYVITSKNPAEALEILKPFLKNDIYKRLIENIEKSN